MKKEETIIEKMERIYYVWDFVSKEQAKEMLQKMYLQSDKLKNIEEQRLVLHNLTTVIMQIEKKKPFSEMDMSQAKHYSKTLIDILDSYPNYKKTQLNKERYCKALNNYTVCHEDELTKEELTNIYQFIYDTYKKYDYEKDKEKYMEKLIADFNVNLAKQNFNQVLKVVEDLILHNNTTEYDETLKSFVKDIENADIISYKKVLLLIENQQKQII